MRKFFILTLMVASLMMVSCVERRNRVILEKFIPVTAADNCEIKANGDKYYTDGIIDLAFTFDYQLAFQVKNYIPASDGGSSESSLTTAEANYFYADKVEIEYEWDPRPQADGRKLTLDQNLWNKKTRNTEHQIVVGPGGDVAAGSVHIFEEAQAKNLLEHVNDIDWIASPLIVKIRVLGELADGTEVETNKMNLNIFPTFGTTIQMSSVYPYPEGGFQDETGSDGKTVCAAKVQFNAIKNACAFNETILYGCYAGQDWSQVNCYAGDTEWERFIAETYCQSESSCYITGYAAASVVEMIYNTMKKPADDTNYYLCCPSELPEEPECPEEDDSNAAGGAGGASGTGGE
jgi:hypothetical protein